VKEAGVFRFGREIIDRNFAPLHFSAGAAAALQPPHQLFCRMKNVPARAKSLKMSAVVSPHKSMGMLVKNGGGFRSGVKAARFEPGTGRIFFLGFSGFGLSRSVYFGHHVNNLDAALSRV